MDEPPNRCQAAGPDPRRDPRLHQRLKTTVIYVTHDQVEAMTMGDRIAVMRDGVLQQVGTPEQLYEHPANIFVAGFIGSPAMNFVTATAEGSALRVGDRHLALNGKAAEVVAGLDKGTELSVGFRPEHLELGEGAPADAIRIPARAEVVEFLGDEELIHARADGGELLAVISSDHRLRPATWSSSGWLCPNCICSTRRASWRCSTERS